MDMRSMGMSRVGGESSISPTVAENFFFYYVNPHTHEVNSADLSQYYT